MFDYQRVQWLEHFWMPRGKIIWEVLWQRFAHMPQPRSKPSHIQMARAVKTPYCSTSLMGIPCASEPNIIWFEIAIKHDQTWSNHDGGCYMLCYEASTDSEPLCLHHSLSMLTLGIPNLLVLDDFSFASHPTPNFNSQSMKQVPHEYEFQ